MPAKKSPARPRELLFGDLWEFDPAPESAEPFIAPRYGLFIDGRFTAPKSKKYFDSIAPRNGAKLSEIALANAADVDAAYTAAARAFPAWSKLPGKERGKYLFRIARLLQDRAREFAVAETLDGGKPIKESRDFDLPMAAAHFFYHAGWADKLEFVAPGRTLQQLGVIGQVIPWNFPLLMLAWKIAPALATGNTVVLKPAETTSITALKFATILEQAGLPPGVVNIVTGAGETGAAVVSHPLAAKIAFTGSTEVGKIIQRALAGSGRKLSLELGGKAANIVFEDAPLDQAVEGIVNGIFFNQGHVCCAGSRLLVQESVAELVIAKLKRRMQVLRVGDPLDKNTDIGAINSAEQLAKIKDLVASGVKEGAELHQPACKLPAKGFYFAPTLFTKVTQSHRVAREEIFGPVLSVLTFRTPEEAIEKANNTPFGLSAGVWTDKGSKILKMAAELKAGVVWANTYNKFDPSSPFGGYKQSGFGREGGKHGLLDYATPGECRVISDPETHSLPRTIRTPNRRTLPLITDHSALPLMLPITKTPKCFVGGAFIRSESGRVYEIHRSSGEFFANIPRCTRKDVRNAVEAAAKAGAGWAKRTPYNRAQILYRLAEMLEARAPEMSVAIALHGTTPDAAAKELCATIERIVHFAGWADKYEQVLGSVNPVASPHFNFTITEPMGIIGVLAPEDAPLLALMTLVLPAITTGNSVVALASHAAPYPAILLGEMLATSDFPGGVVNLLTGERKEMLPTFATHEHLRAVAATATKGEATDLQRGAAESVKRVVLHDPKTDWFSSSHDSPYALRDFTEAKTVWHPIGA